MGKLPACNVCGKPDAEVMYRSSEHTSMTTMCRLYDQPTVVYFCNQCGHLQTKEILNIEEYYAYQYAILADSSEEDQLYKVTDGKRIFQVEHRARTLLEKVDIPRGARILDFGCAKGAFGQRLKRDRPDIVPSLFDVTERYLTFWRSFAPSSQWATGTTPADWTGTMDVVCSFYVLEHVADPVEVVTHMASLLRPGGTLYFLVPNLLANTADMIVADHLQHFSESSLLRLMSRVGLETLAIDSQSHDAAHIAIARRTQALPASHSPKSHLTPGDLREEYQAISRFWSSTASRIHEFEKQHDLQTAACIYGAGFYGNFIASCLKNQSAISCFIDQNPFMQGRSLHGKPIVAPGQLADEVSLMYVGLNPAVARAAIADIGCWSGRQFDAFYL